MVDENYIMEIQGATTLTFPITPEFFPAISSTWKRDGKQEVINRSIPVHGYFSESSQDAVNTAIEQLHDLAENRTPLTFIFKKETSGTVIYQLNHAFIQDLREENSGGSRVGHVEFSFTITKEDAAFYSNLVAFSDTETLTREPDNTGAVRTLKVKTVSASGKDGNINAAKQWVNARKPSGVDILREVQETIDFDATYTVTWTIDNTKEPGPGGGGTGDPTIHRWQENATIMPGLESLSWYRTEGAAVPLIGGRGPSTLQISGNVIARQVRAFPNADTLIMHFFQNVPQAKGRRIRDLQIGMPQPFEYKADDPDVPTLYRKSYSFRIEFAEDSTEQVPNSADRHWGVRYNSLKDSVPPAGGGRGRGGVGQGVPPGGPPPAPGNDKPGVPREGGNVGDGLQISEGGPSGSGGFFSFP